jgi:hypothetical protein
MGKCFDQCQPLPSLAGIPQRATAQDDHLLGTDDVFFTREDFPDYGYTATLLTDGRVLFLGSVDFGFADAEVNDPPAGTFAFTGNRSRITKSPQLPFLSGMRLHRVSRTC